jgi:hypothetical protein
MQLDLNTQYPELIRASLKMKTIILSLTKPEISEPHTPNSSATFWKLSHYITSMFILRLERGKSHYTSLFILTLERGKSHYTSRYNKNFTLHIIRCILRRWYAIHLCCNNSYSEMVVKSFRRGESLELWRWFLDRFFLWKFTGEESKSTQ